MKRRALVIDDHLPSRTFLIKALNKSGFEVAGDHVGDLAESVDAEAWHRIMDRFITIQKP